MNHSAIISELEKNNFVFQAMLQVDQNQQYWKPLEKKWNLLEVVCHLYDEEREDFRHRIKHVFTTPDQPFPPIDPEGWVSERNYQQKNFEEVLRNFLNERSTSIKWLRSLENPAWKNKTLHQALGEITAETLLANWLAHDFFHFRQINRLKYEFLKSHSAVPLDYAGN